MSSNQELEGVYGHLNHNQFHLFHSDLSEQGSLVTNS